MLYTLGVNNKKLILHGRFHSILKLAQKLEHSPKKFGTDELLSHSEIHLIEIIGDNQDMSVTDIAKEMGLTKGAVSQSLKKLETKGFTGKLVDEANQSRSIVQLTSKGFISYYSHKQWHEEMDGGFAKYMKELNENELNTILTFLEKVEVFLEKRVEAEK